MDNLSQARSALLSLLGTRGDFAPGSLTYDVSMLALSALQVTRDGAIQSDVEREILLCENCKIRLGGLRSLSEAERVAILNAAHRALFNA